MKDDDLTQEARELSETAWKARRALYLGSFQVVELASSYLPEDIEDWLKHAFDTPSSTTRFSGLQHVVLGPRLLTAQNIVPWSSFDPYRTTSIWDWESGHASLHGLLLAFFFSQSPRNLTVCAIVQDKDVKVARSDANKALALQKVASVPGLPSHFVLHEPTVDVLERIHIPCASVSLDFGACRELYTDPYHHALPFASIDAEDDDQSPAERYLGGLSRAPILKASKSRTITFYRTPKTILDLLETDRWKEKLGHIVVVKADPKDATGGGDQSGESNEVEAIGPKAPCKCERGD